VVIRRTLIYRGTVQGVGFRWTAVRAAGGFDVTGYVRNLADGQVELVAEGEAGEISAFCAALEEHMAGYIIGAEARDSAATGEFRSFGVAY